MNDPFRSAEIIISHVTDGDKMARQYHLPARIRDFILEHHGTTQASYFYHQALERAGNDKEVDIEQFTYPGPKPQSRETAILMLADSSEATVRSRKPTRKQEIFETVQQVIEDKVRSGQLDESGLTLNDIDTIRRIFTDMLQGVFHPRISYPANLKRDSGTTEAARLPAHSEATTPDMTRTVRDTDKTPPVVLPVESSAAEAPTTPRTSTKELPAIKPQLDEDEMPLPEVPPLPRAGDYNAVHPGDNGSQPPKKDVQEE